MNSELPDPLEVRLKAMGLAAARKPWRDQLIFAAGQASVQRRHWLWMGPTCGVAGLLIGVVASRWPQEQQHHETNSRMMTHAVPQSEPIPLPPVPALEAVQVPLNSGKVTEEARRAWRDRELVFRFGVDALSSTGPVVSADEPMSLYDLMKQESMR